MILIRGAEDLGDAWEVTGLPILVTENGIATSDDDRRIAYTTDALRGLSAAMADGADVRGYLHWSLLDNYEWGHWEPTFGLAAVDRETFERKAKPSLVWLGGVARTNGAAVTESLCDSEVCSSGCFGGGVGRLVRGCWGCCQRWCGAGDGARHLPCAGGLAARDGGVADSGDGPLGDGANLCVGQGHER